MLSNFHRFFSNLFGKTAPAGRQDAAAIHSLDTQIQALVRAGETEGALQMLVTAGYTDAILLATQLQNGQTLFDQKKITYQEWRLIDNRINYAVLHFFKKEQEAPRHTVPATKVPITEQQRAEVHQLVLKHRTEEALALCAGWGPHFVLTKERFFAVKRDWILGLISEEDWTLQQKRIEYALSELIREHPGK